VIVTLRLHDLEPTAMKFLLWLILFVIAWPIALLALLLYPLVWLLMLPFRIIGISVSGVLETLRAVVTLPARVLGGRPG
jgi:hypothetical protein